MFVTYILSRLQKYVSYRKRYHQTVRELSHLSDRDLADLGFSRFEIPAVARKQAA